MQIPSTTCCLYFTPQKTRVILNHWSILLDLSCYASFFLYILLNPEYTSVHELLGFKRGELNLQNLEWAGSSAFLRRGPHRFKAHRTVFVFLNHSCADTAGCLNTRYWFKKKLQSTQSKQERRYPPNTAGSWFLLVPNRDAHEQFPSSFHGGFRSEVCHPVSSYIPKSCSKMLSKATSSKWGEQNSWFNVVTFRSYWKVLKQHIVGTC